MTYVVKDVISADAAADAGGRSEVLVQSWTSNIICFKPLTALLRQQAVCFAQASFSHYWRSFLTVGSCVCEGSGIGLTRPNCKRVLFANTSFHASEGCVPYTWSSLTYGCAPLATAAAKKMSF